MSEFILDSNSPSTAKNVREAKLSKINILDNDYQSIEQVKSPINMEFEEDEY